MKWDSRRRKKWREGSFHNSWVAPLELRPPALLLNFHIRFQYQELMEDFREVLTVDTGFSEHFHGG